ncbi:sensor histidine kinase [Reichenbachiella ulvae]|uniref:histidine kinase n=1 Tax=Reichenbachiella ulvae TaxID=2980104 RepID=A0ABT3CPQ5_9BACT|nr:HAMP domain-containing sensor histidine kinase [Reichenbachiella ulvae]MCV9385523.1 HAMP domain-containing histidine kinase [Reichenbachiella ulvae]
MFNKERFQKLLLGNARAFSPIERSRIKFSAGAIVMVILSSLIFLTYDLYLGYPSSLWVFTPFILIFGYAWRLLRLGQFDAGRYLLLVALNFFIYIVMSSIPEDSMSAIFYVGIMVVEYVLLGHDKKLRLFALLCLSFALYCLDAYVEFSILPMREYDEETLQVNKLVDFVVCVAGILMTIKLLIDHQQDIIAERTQTNEELQRLNNELDKYAYTITHDLKGPIHSIHSLIHMPDIDHANFNQYLSTMRESFQSLSELIQDVSEQARNRNFEVTKEKFNMRERVEIIWELTRHAPEAQGIEFILDMPKELMVATDKGRITGMLNNLITNSIRYHDKSKEKAYIKVSGKVVENNLHFSVEDNGLGIETEFQEKVFDMFYRASNKLGGSGLGLFTVKESINKLSGKIQLDSTSGKGTTFSIVIPDVGIEEL